MFESALALAAPQFVFLGMQVPPAYTVREILEDSEQTEPTSHPLLYHHALELHKSFNTYLKFSMIWFLVSLVLVVNRFGWIGIPFIIFANLFYTYLVYFIYHREVYNSKIAPEKAVKIYFESVFGPRVWMDMDKDEPSRKKTGAPTVI
jgi:hypothetical protein